MICISIADVTPPEALDLIRKNDLSEVRLDRIDFDEEDIAGFFSAGRDTIATFRPCGKADDDTRKRILLMAIEDGATYADIEVENSDSFKNEIITAAALKKCKVIVSYHNYDRTPSLMELEHIISWCLESGADYAKIACHAASRSDSARLLSLYGYGKPVISIGMGDTGRITRIAAVLLGSPFTYASIDDSRKAAPGQIESEKLKAIIRMIKEG